MYQKIITHLLLIIPALWSFSLFSEEEPAPPLPETEIYLFDVSHSENILKLSHMKNISNHKGYDNQPYFTPESKTVLFTSGRDGKQTDIFEYDLKSRKLSQLTKTPFMEYSPTPSDDNGTIAFVRDGENPNQTIWQLDRKSGKSRWAINTLEPVGYFAMNQKKSDWLFWSRYGFNVTYLNLNKKQQRFVSGHAIPSSPKRIPHSDRFSFVHRQTNETVWIKSFDPETGAVTPIIPISGSNYDYCWTPNGQLLRTEGTRLYIAQPGKDWKLIQDLKSFGLHRITRLAMSPDGTRLAAVDNQ